MRVLYLGATNGTSLQRAGALTRLGHSVRLIDPASFVPKGRLKARLHYETGGILCSRHVGRSILSGISGDRFDLIWVCGGQYVDRRLVETLRRLGPVVNYNNDDPYGRRDRGSWRTYLGAVPAYDLVVVVREPNVAEARARGARNVLCVVRSADEVAHRPRTLTPQDHTRFDSDVLFLGTAMPERGPFLAQMIRRGVPLTIRGNGYQKRKEWPILQSAWKGPGLAEPDDYSRAIQCAKICLGLVSEGNRDLHTQRSLEIPSLGGLFCGKRTIDHQRMYREHEEAAFWETPDECAEVCFRLLDDETRRREMAARGRQRFLANGHTNERTLKHILNEVCEPSAALDSSVE